MICCYRFIEDSEKLEFWADLSNCEYYTFEEEDDDWLINGKKYWIISESGKILWATNSEDVNKEWYFENNCIK